MIKKERKKRSQFRDLERVFNVLALLLVCIDHYGIMLGNKILSDR